MQRLNTKIQIGSIVRGHAYEVLNKHRLLSESRLAVCNTCPLKKDTKLGPVCHKSYCLNPETEEFRESPAEGFICGCGCRLNAKTRLQSAHCPLAKW